jgi:hypothetical protein
MYIPLGPTTLRKRTYQWGDEQEKALDELRNAMVRAPVLALPNATDPFILDTDASDKSVGAELIQIQEGEERAVEYGSLTLTPEQQKYCTTRKECLKGKRHLSIFFNKGPMVIGEPQKPLHLLFILRPWPVFYIFDISWPNVYSSRSHYSSKTAFITKYGLFEFARMAFGLCNSPATYTRVINLVLRGLNWKVVLAFLDDILVLGKDFEGHGSLRART